MSASRIGDGAGEVWKPVYEMRAFRDESRGEMIRIHAEVGGLRERMARLEGLLEGLREAITGRGAA